MLWQKYCSIRVMIVLLEVKYGRRGIGKGENAIFRQEMPYWVLYLCENRIQR